MRYGLLIVFTLLTSWVFATHNRAGEITYRHVSGNTYDITLITYTKDSAPADRPVLVVQWGDGTADTLARVQETQLGNDIKRNTYEGRHTYPSVGTYVISMEDPNRNQGILNIPESVSVPFYIETILNINPATGPNNSPQLLNAPIDNGCVNQIFIHNPAAFDPDGDSLSYTLVDCRGANGQPIPGFTTPMASTSIGINPVNGDFIWDTPILAGEYNIAIQITEHRLLASGAWAIVGQTVRDMQIDIAGCSNTPPEIDAIENLCVIAGDTARFDVTATDPDLLQSIQLSAYGGPFVLSPSALFPQPAQGSSPLTRTFLWGTDCSLIRLQPYAVTFKARDNGIPNLVDLHTVNIRVIAPPPLNPTTQVVPDAIQLNWQSSSCSDVARYDVYRREGSFTYVPDSCTTGLPAWTGYGKVGSTSDGSVLNFLDNNGGSGLSPGIQYCYRVVAVYADGSESLPSEEVCDRLLRDRPLLTQVDVVSTDAATGEIFVRWLRATELDTALYPGPYSYKLYRSEGFSTNATEVEVASFATELDTFYLDATGLNTQDLAYTYRVELYDASSGTPALVSSSIPASSVYLSTVGQAGQVQLNWQFSHPWTNVEYVVYRRDPAASSFDSIASVSGTFYANAGLEMLQEYCYFVVAKGLYTGIPDLDTLRNRSQRQCATTIDSVPPCPPELSVVSDCELNENLLEWNLPSQGCEEEASSYTLYYRPIGSEDFILLTTLNAMGGVESWLHDQLEEVAGCYLVVATDSFGNVSEPSETVCVDNCPAYELPNVFTPDGDLTFDLYNPVTSRNVEEVDFVVYNRWGTEVFRTRNPQIEWDGTHQQTGIPVSEGVYYYVCKVAERRLSGISYRELNGFFHLYRGQ